MAKNWEDTFRFWGRAPSPTEQEKCENAERAIRKAIKADPELSQKNISIIPQGSYRNRTNVRLDSDVDICVCLNEVVFYDAPYEEASLGDFGMTPATYSYEEFKNDLGRALANYFGEGSVTRGDKAFDIHRNTYRIDADVVAAFEHRRYTQRGFSGWLYLTGTEFRPDSGGRIINWPEQHYTNGVTKNQATSERYKAIARVFKNLRNEMEEDGIAEAKPMASFLLECLVYNVPNHLLMAADYKPSISASLSHIFNSTALFQSCSEWVEVNGLKWLFRGTQPWTFQEVNAFSLAAWRYAECGSD